MSCYCQGHQVVTLCICCQRSPCSRNCSRKGSEVGERNDANTIIEGIQRNFAQILQRELKSLTDRKQAEINELSVMVSRLKSEILRLQNRNKLDKDNENRLKDEVKRLSARIRELEDLLNRASTSSVKQVKQIMVEQKKVAEPEKMGQKVQTGPELDFLKEQIARVNSQKLLLEETNKNLQDKIKRITDGYESKITELNHKIDELSRKLRQKDNSIDELQKNTIQISQKLAILSLPARFQPEPIILHKVTNQPAEVRTVYIDRPVERTKIVEVEKVIRHFMEPDRPVVNRIIECPPSRGCRCDDEAERSQGTGKASYREQLEDRNENLREQYNEVINSYKDQRQKLVKAIENRDSQYRLLSKKVQLIQKITSKSNKKCGHQDIVEVKVWKDGERQGSEPSEKRTKNQNNGAATGTGKVTGKSTFVRTEQKVRKN